MSRVPTCNQTSFQSAAYCQPGSQDAVLAGGGDELMLTTVIATRLGVSVVGIAIPELLSTAAGFAGIAALILLAVNGREIMRATPTDRLKEHLTDDDLDAARRESNGEVVARRSDGTPYDHVQEVSDAQQGLLNRIDELNRKLTDHGLTGRLTEGQVQEIMDELREASKLLDHSERFLPR